MNENTTTGCECTESGWCEKHQCRKTEHWRQLCRNHAGYFRLWEEGRGPGQHRRHNPSTQFSCRHQGKPLREQQCPTCDGSVRLKIFACQRHGECTLAKAISGVACCAQCEDYDRNEDADMATAGPARQHE